METKTGEKEGGRGRERGRGRKEGGGSSKLRAEWRVERKKENGR